MNNDATTHGIANKGFSGLRSFVSRFNFTNGGYERSPQSLTCPTVRRCKEIHVMKGYHMYNPLTQNRWLPAHLYNHHPVKAPGHSIHHNRHCCLADKHGH